MWELLNFENDKGNKFKKQFISFYKNDGIKFFWVRLCGIKGQKRIGLLQLTSLYGLSHVDSLGDGIFYKLSQSQDNLLGEPAIVLLGKIDKTGATNMVYQLEASIPDKVINEENLRVELYQQRYSKMLSKYPQLWDFQ